MATMDRNCWNLANGTPMPPLASLLMILPSCSSFSSKPYSSRAKIKASFRLSNPSLLMLYLSNISRCSRVFFSAAASRFAFSLATFALAESSSADLTQALSLSMKPRNSGPFLTFMASGVWPISSLFSATMRLASSAPSRAASAASSVASAAANMLSGEASWTPSHKGAAAPSALATLLSAASTSSEATLASVAIHSCSSLFLASSSNLFLSCSSRSLILASRRFCT
mmetsp:Transcript_81434/g.263767  ORF Transcript_81434/g.263767 Transcript_81434/m.263767 type:complete len:227 (+) Transcript_81434:1262-1942(+)